MVNQTNDKLAEATFFLDLLKQNRGKVEKFNHFLNAFICSARSVRWIMKYEYLRVPGWTDWIEEKDKTRTEDVEALYKGTTEMRNNAQKQGSLKASARYRLRFSKASIDQLVGHSGRLSLSMSGTTGNCTLHITKENGVRITIPATQVTDLTRQVEEFPSQDVVDVCQNYHDHLSALVSECARQFGPGRQGTEK